MIEGDIEEQIGEITVEELIGIIYCAVVAATKVIDVKIKSQTTALAEPKAEFNAPRERQIEEKLKKLRADLNKVTQFLMGNKAKRIQNKCRRIEKESTVHNTCERNNILNEDVIDNGETQSSNGKIEQE